MRNTASIKARMWIEWVLAAVAAVLTVLSLVWPTWFESLSGESPDGGDGSFERLLALVWLAVAVTFAVLARRNQRRIAVAAE